MTMMACNAVYEEIVERLKDLSEAQLSAIHTIVTGLAENNKKGTGVPDNESDNKNI